ncbi:integrase, catalytic region, zinc finger, CCHC-type containing protein [Tanacetum coccineum]
MLGDYTESVPNPKVISPGMFKLDLKQLPHHLKQDREAHVSYLKVTNENVDILCDLVEQAKVSNPLENALGHVCMYAKKIQELLVYLSETCPSPPKENSKKLVAVTPMNKSWQVTFANPSTTSEHNTQKQVESHKTQTTDKPLVPSTSIKSVSNDSGSKNRHNTKHSRISQPSSSNQKYQKVDGQPSVNKKEWIPTGKVFKNVGYKWLPTGRTFTIVGRQRSQLTNVVEKFIGTVRFGNDQVAAIMGYGDYQFGNVTISRVYYVEGFGHNLISVGQFCDADIEVAFCKHSCFVHDLEGVDLLKGSRGSNLYSISPEDMMKSSPICLLSKVSKTKSWLWHRRLSHLNFGNINQLAK